MTLVDKINECPKIEVASLNENFVEFSFRTYVYLDKGTTRVMVAVKMPHVHGEPIRPRLEVYISDETGASIPVPDAWRDEDFFRSLQTFLRVNRKIQEVVPTPEEKSSGALEKAMADVDPLLDAIAKKMHYHFKGLTAVAREQAVVVLLHLLFEKKHALDTAHDDSRPQVSDIK